MKTLLCAAVIVLSCGFALGQQYKVLYSFAGAQAGDGAAPVSNLVFDHAGNLYGTTLAGGSNAVQGGVVFELSPLVGGTWTETILYSFCSQAINLDCLDGAGPQAGLVLDSAGSFYGTTTYGGNSTSCGIGSGCGTVFKLTPPSSPAGQWTETVLYNFCTNYVNRQCLDGFFPHSQLTFDKAGNLYGTASSGGSGHAGGGIVFELSHGAGGWTQTVLYNFCSLGTGDFCPDGTLPEAGVIFDKAGNLYGTTGSGGGIHSIGGGIVFKLSPGSGGWTETVLKAGREFGPGSPLGTLSFDPQGNLYSTFSAGGSGNAGGVFRLGPNGSGVEFSFNFADGSTPAAGVWLDSRRPALYGTTSTGGLGFGNVFKIVAPAQESVLYNFCSQSNCADGSEPLASLVQDKSGNLYGTTKEGGINNQGLVFEILQSFPKQKASQRPAPWHTILPSKD